MEITNLNVINALWESLTTEEKTAFHYKHLNNKTQNDVLVKQEIYLFCKYYYKLSSTFEKPDEKHYSTNLLSLNEFRDNFILRFGDKYSHICRVFETSFYKKGFTLNISSVFLNLLLEHDLEEAYKLVIAKFPKLK